VGAKRAEIHPVPTLSYYNVDNNNTNGNNCNESNFKECGEHQLLIGDKNYGDKILVKVVFLIKDKVSIGEIFLTRLLN
jgi:hypothetical protein